MMVSATMPVGAGIAISWKVLPGVIVFRSSAYCKGG